MDRVNARAAAFDAKYGNRRTKDGRPLPTVDDLYRNKVTHSPLSFANEVLWTYPKGRRSHTTVQITYPKERKWANLVAFSIVLASITITVAAAFYFVSKVIL